MRSLLQKCSVVLPLVLVIPTTSSAQLVNIRTAPVSVPQQFLTAPSRYLGMGGSTALDDLEGDPFSNPATAGRIRGGIASLSPSFYNVGNNAGFGRTLPLTVMGGGTSAFAGFSIAPQELQSTPRNANWWQTVIPGFDTERFAHNFFGSVLLGQRFEKSQSAAAVSISRANLNRVHMVDLLYPEARSVDQGGGITDIRVGYTKELSRGRTLEAVVVGNHVDMEHDVTYVDVTWSQQLSRMVTSLPRVEHNADRTSTFGGKVMLKGPMPTERGWRLAGALTANTKTHPKIPNYAFMNIPRDPGNSWAFAVDGGAAYVSPENTWSLDMTYMPIWTSTWAEAATGMKTAKGGFIAAGSPTIENEFVFNNINLHGGFQHQFQNGDIQLGLNLLHVSYALDQYDHIREQARQSNEGWTESTLTWGFSIGVGSAHVRYFGMHQGNFDFGFESKAPIVNVSTPATGGGGGGIDVVAAPSSPLSMSTTPVTAHQFVISIPFGRR